MTTEAALTKLMHCLGQGLEGDDLRNAMRSNLRGEITKFSPVALGALNGAAGFLESH